MKKIIDNIEITRCKAAAISAGDTTLQDALFIHDLNDDFHDGDAVVFGYDMPEDAADLKNIFGDPSAISRDSEDLSTIRVPEED